MHNTKNVNADTFEGTVNAYTRNYKLKEKQMPKQVQVKIYTTKCGRKSFTNSRGETVRSEHVWRPSNPPWALKEPLRDRNGRELTCLYAVMG